jgi:Domain of unknown function (DUF4350)
VSRRRVVLGVVGLVIALNVASQAVEIVFPEPSGPPSSAYATSEDGFAAFAELLRREGHEVDRLRKRPHELELDPTTTVVIADAGVVEARDADALESFVERGGRLVAAGAAFGWLGRIVEPPPQWTPGGAEHPRVLAPRPELLGLRRITRAAGGSWADAGASLPLLGDEDASLLTVARVGRGDAFLLADAGPLRNEALALGDNAALGLALAGARGRRVAFLESYHGFGDERGFAAIPRGWLVTLGGMVAAALAFMLARGRRLGPPEAASRELAPPRRLFVESLGTLLARTGRPAEAVAPLRERALEAAERLGVTPDERRVLEETPRTADDLVRLGKATAALERRLSHGARGRLR